MENGSAQRCAGRSKHLKNTYASETPVTDGERLYVYFANVDVFCLDLDGQELWSVEWPPRRTRSGWGIDYYYTLLDRGSIQAVFDPCDEWTSADPLRDAPPRRH